MRLHFFVVTLTILSLVVDGFHGVSRSRAQMSPSVKQNMIHTRSSRSDIKAVDPYGSGNSGNEGRRRETGLKKTPLTQRSGARPLTRAERKAKELYEGQLNAVERVHSPASRVPLSELNIGQKLRGRIISVKDFGLFVDVGSKRDGLVHIKDVSKDYFISQLETKFVPGQDVDVWVKFCEPKKYKLGLQMFPVTETTKARSRATLKSSKSHRDALALPADLEDSDAATLAMQLAQGELDDTALALAEEGSSDYDGTDDIFLTPLEAYTVGDEVEGKVIRMSNFGVFVEFGAEVVGFLHKRKMAVAPKRRALKPWEIVPIGSTVTAYVVEVDLDRRRVNLSTYTPDRWADMLPAAPAMVKTEDGKFLPASSDSSTRQVHQLGSGEDGDDDDLFSNEALERQLAASLGEDEDEEEEGEYGAPGRSSFSFGDEEDEDDEEDDEDFDDRAFDTRGEDLSAAEVRALMQASNQQSSRDRAAAARVGQVTNAKIVIDDLGGSGQRGGDQQPGEREFDRRDRSPESIQAFQAALAAEREVAAAMEEGEELLTEEIFAELCPRGRGVLTLKEVRKWDYVRDLIADGDITEEALRSLVIEASGASSGKLTLETFDDFIDLLAESLGLEEAGGEADQLEHFLGDAQELPFPSPEKEGEGGGGTDGMVFELLPDTSEEGDIEGLEDLPESDYELVEEDADEESESESESEAVEGDHDEFVFTVETSTSPSAVRASGPGADLVVDDEEEDEDDDEDDFEIDLSVRDDDELFGGTSGPAAASAPNPGLEGLVQSASRPSKVKGQDLLRYVFASMSQGDPQGASLEHCLAWDFVNALLEKGGSGSVSKAEVEEAFHSCVASSSSGSAKQAGRLDLPAFNEYMGLLTDLESRDTASRNRELISASLVEVGEGEDLLDMDLQQPLPVGNPTDGLMRGGAGTSGSDTVVAAFTTDEEEDEEDQLEWAEQGGEDEEEEEEDEMTIEEAFETLSEGRKTVSREQLMTWDVIDELFEAGVLDEAELDDLINRAGARGRGTLTLDGFEALLDLLSPLTDDISDDEDYEALEGLHRAAGASEGAGEEDEEDEEATSLRAAVAEDDNDDDEKEEDEEDEEVLLGKVFDSLAHGKPRATVKDLLSWDFVLELMGEGLLTEDLLADKMAAAGGTTKGLEVQQFDAFVDSLVELYGTEEETEDDARAFDERVSLASAATATPEGVDDGDEHDDFEYDVDIEAAFEQLAGSNSEDAAMTLQQLMEWELLQSMVASDLISEKEVSELLAQAGVMDTDSIDKQAFEAFVDELVDEDEGYEDE